MNWDRFEGEWKEFRGRIKTKWAKLTDDDLKMVEAKKDELIGKVQQRYGILREEAERQIDEWLDKLPPSKSHDPGKHSGTPRA
jgi:uncharacterized protein YjbJ (UPF0337 family)